MTLTIGRLTLDNCNVTYPRAGRALTISGWLTASSLIELRALVQQTWGMYDNPGEPVVPVTYTDNPHLDGYYRIGQVTLPGHWLGDCEAALSSGAETVAVPFSIGLDPVEGYAAAQFDARWHFDFRTNVHSWSVITPLIAVPRIADADFYTGADETRAGQTTDLIVVDLTSGTPPTSGDGLWYVAPADFYDGAATIEMDYGDGIWRQVVGGDPPNLPVGWRLNNNLCRVRPVFDAGDLRFLVEIWDPVPSVWRPWTIIVTEAGAGFVPIAVQQTSAVRVVRNTPAVVAVEVATRDGFGTTGALTVTQIVLRRGMRFIEVTNTLITNVVYTWGVKVDAGGTGSTAGMEAGSLKRDTNSGWMLASPDTVTRDTAEPGIHRTTGAVGWRFGFGGSMTIPGENLDDATQVVRQYIAALAETHTVVER